LPANVHKGGKYRLCEVRFGREKEFKRVNTSENEEEKRNQELNGSPRSGW